MLHAIETLLIENERLGDLIDSREFTKDQSKVFIRLSAELNRAIKVLKSTKEYKKD